MRRPPTLHVDHVLDGQLVRVRVRVRRGPRASAWYWEADRADGKGGRQPVWSGWATRTDVARLVLEALTTEERPEIACVGDLLDRWLGAVREQRTRDGDLTLTAIETAVTRLLAGPLPEVEVEALAAPHLVAHRDHALAEGYAASTIRREIKYLRQAWKWGQEQIPPQVPLRRLPAVRVDGGRVNEDYTPTLAEVALLLGVVAPSVRRAIVLLAGTGARVGEILALTWGEVPLDGRRYQVEGKTGPRLVDVDPAIAAEVLSWPRGAPDERVVKLSQARLWRALRAASDKVGIQHVTANGLRRMMVDTLYETADSDPGSAAAQLGHSAQTALVHYRRVRGGRRRAIVEAAGVGSSILGPSEPGTPDGTDAEDRPGKRERIVPRGR